MTSLFASKEVKMRAAGTAQSAFPERAALDFGMESQMTLASILACRGPWPISVDSLRRELESQFGLRPRQLEEELSTRPGDTGAGGAVVKLNGIPLAITVHAVPLPEDQWIYGPQPNLFWPKANSELSAHKAHIRVLVLEKPKSRVELVQYTMALGLLTSAVCRAADAIGVLWCPSDNLLSATHFVGSNCNHFQKNILPMDVYVRLVVVNSSNGVALATHGLRSYVGREVEFVPMKPTTISLENMIDRAFMIAETLFIGATETPGKLEPGDVVGPERLVVRLDDKGDLENGPVYRLLPPGET